MQRCAWPRGKVLGGSGSINNLIYVRGNRHDYDGWAREGCDGWSYKEVLPYFIKSEDIQMPEFRNSGNGSPYLLVCLVFNITIYVSTADCYMIPPVLTLQLIAVKGDHSLLRMAPSLPLLTYTDRQWRNWGTQTQTATAEPRQVNKFLDNFEIS